MRSSFMDRIVGPEGWFARIPWWVWVPAAWTASLLMLQGAHWIDGSTDFLRFDRDVIAAPFYLVAPAAGYAYLTRVARTAFDRFRPALDEDEADRGWRHRISSLFPLAMWLPFWIGGSALAAITYLDEASTTGELMRTSGLATTTWSMFNVASFGLHFVVGALIVRQIWLVARLHRRAVHIDLFRPDPLHAFASLTARAGVVVVALVVYSALTDPTTFENRAYLGVFLAGITVGGATFLLPLLGMRNRLRHEKGRLRDEVAGRLSALTSELHEAIDARRLGEIGDLKTTLEVLAAEQQRIRKTSAWPWETATIRGFVTTLLVPVTIWLVTSLLSETLGL